MEDFNSKYSGQQVEDLLDQVASGNAGGGGGGGITVETDPIFSGSPAASITEDDKEAWNNKVSYSAKDFSMVNADGFMTSEGEGFVFPNTPAAQAEQGFVLATLDDIPNAITEADITAMGFTKNTGTYSKPSGGIPKSDLAEEVQNALRYAEQDRGTVTAIKVNGKNKGANNGVVDLGNLGTYSTYIADFTMEELRDGIYNGTNVECDTQALITSMNANKIILVREGKDSAYKGVYVLNGYAEDLLYFSIVDSSGNILWCEGTDYSSSYIDGRSLYLHSWYDKQDTLISGENIKTINGESIVGKGNVNVGKIAYISEEDTLELSPGVVSIRTRMVVNSVQITGFASNDRAFAEYAYHFCTGTIADGSAVKLILPDGVKYANREIFDALESDTHYELSVVRSDGIAKAVLTAFK